MVQFLKGFINEIATKGFFQILECFNLITNNISKNISKSKKV